MELKQTDYYIDCPCFSDTLRRNNTLPVDSDTVPLPFPEDQCGTKYTTIVLKHIRSRFVVSVEQRKARSPVGVASTISVIVGVICPPVVPATRRKTTTGSHSTFAESANYRFSCSNARVVAAV